MASLRSQVRTRARRRCEYCHMPENGTNLPHEIDHIRARKHRGSNALDNICWCCAQCNGAKGSDVSGFDPASDELIPLFHPRWQQWDDHFSWDGPILIGKTPAGRATVELLRINRADRVEHRRLLMERGAFG